MSMDPSNGGPGLERLRDVLDAHGAAPERWPAAERDALSALLARSAEARRLHEDAARLDAALDALPASSPSTTLEDRIVAAALAGAATATHQVSSLATARARRDAGARRRSAWLTAALPLAAAAALAVWLATGTEPEPAQVAVIPAATPADDAALAEIALAELGVYETPGDELLEISGLDDVYGADPWHGCAAGELGCLEMDTTLPLEPVSRDETDGQEVRLLA